MREATTAHHFQLPHEVHLGKAASAYITSTNSQTVNDDSRRRQHEHFW